MNLLNLIEDINTGYDNLRALMNAVRDKTDAALNVGGEPITLSYPEARWMMGKYQAFNRAGRQAEFINDLGDAYRFDQHMKQLRNLIAKQKAVTGSVPGQRNVPGETTTPYLKETDGINRALLNWERMVKDYELGRQIAELDWGGQMLTVNRRQMHGIFNYITKRIDPSKYAEVVNKAFGTRNDAVEFIEHVAKKGFIPREMPKLKPRVDPNTPDLFDPAQTGGPKSPRMQSQEAAEPSQKKKNSDGLDRSTAVNPKVARAFQLARARQPATQSDVEAFVKDELDAAERTQAELEQVRQDNDRQSQEIAQLAQVVSQQDREIKDLKSATPTTAAEPARAEPKTEPAKAVAPQAEPEKKAEPAAKEKPAEKPTVGAEPAAAPEKQKAKEKPAPAAKPKKEPAQRRKTAPGAGRRPTIAPIPGRPTTAPVVKRPTTGGAEIISFPGSFGSKDQPSQATGTYGEGQEVHVQGNPLFEGRSARIVGRARDRNFFIVDVEGFGQHVFHESTLQEMQTHIDRFNTDRPILPSGAAKIKYAYDNNIYDDARLQEALPDKALAVLQKLKQPKSAQTAPALDPSKQAEVDQWAQDFQKNVAAKYGRQIVPPAQQIDLNVPSQTTPARRGRPKKLNLDLSNSEYLAIKRKIDQLDELIRMKEQIDKLWLQAQRVRGGITAGLQSDLEGEEMFPVPETDQDVAELRARYAKDLKNLQDFIRVKRIAWKESQETINEGVGLQKLKQARQALATMIDDKVEESLRPGEYHVATVTLDDGRKVRVPITSDEGFREPIIQHFARQGHKVIDIDIDWGVRTNEAKKDRSPGKVTRSEDPCWSGYHMVGKKMKNGREVPNCVPGKKGS